MKTREIEITPEAYGNLEALRRENETIEEVLRRLALAFRVSGLMAADPSSVTPKGPSKSGRKKSN